MTHMLVRFLIVFGVGVGLVWALGIGPQGSWFGEKNTKSVDPVASADVNRPPAMIPTSDEGIQVRELAIPVREELEDRPGVQIIKYWLRIGESVGGIEKHMRARDVRIEIHNKDHEYNDQVVAIVYGAAALILFQTTPDPRANFRDAQIEQMTLSEDVVVEYLDKETGEPVTTLRSTELVLTDQRFHAPGHAVIEQEGLNFSGEDLTYDKATGIFEFKKNVRARVTQFSLPGSKDDSADGSSADGTNIAVAEPVEKVITCDGPFTFIPAEPPPEDPDAVGDLASKADKQSGLTDVVGGGTLTFEDNVVATQGESVLKNCSKLVLHVDKVTSEEDPTDEPTPANGDVASIDTDQSGPEEEDEGKLGIKSMEAYGKAGERAVLVDPRGELYGEVILLEPTEAGREIILRGSPEIKNAVAGTPEANEDPTLVTRMSGGARDEIRVRPLPAEASGTAGADPDADAPEPVERMALELRNKDAWLSANNADPAKSFRIGGDTVDLLFQKIPGEEPADNSPADNSPADNSPADNDLAAGTSTDEPATKGAEPEAESSFELEQLIAEGSANVLFGMGSFRGDKIVGSPKEPGADVSSFSIVVTPNPVVHLDIPKNPDKPDSKDQTIDINTRPGSLTYAPPAADTDDPTAVRMEGKTHVAFSEDGVLVTTLDAEKSVDVEFLVGGASGIKSLTAEGSVVFHSERDGVHGSGDQLELIPTEDGKFKMDLRGSPAVVTQQKGDDPPQIIRARWIIYDPETGKLHAEDHIDRVIATLPGFSPAADTGSGTSSSVASAPGALRARTLDVTPTTDSRGQEDLLVEAVGRVSFRDPEEGIDATGERLVYRESAADAVLFGTEQEPAEVIRIDRESDPNDEEKTPSTVSIRGPKILINKASKSLSCPEDGAVVLVRYDKNKNAKTRVSANASGPVVYRDDQLELHVRVMIRFEEDTGKKRELWEEKRALWCDLATVSFAQSNKADDKASDGSSQDSLGFESLLAQGRVHLEQVEPRPLIGEGETLEFRKVDGRDAMILQGIYPRAWVEGLMTNKHVRYVAETFTFYEGTEEFEVDRGEFFFIGDGQ